MFGIGPAEALIIIVIAVLVLGGPAATFFVGYSLGRKSGKDETGSVDTASTAGTDASNEDRGATDE